MDVGKPNSISPQSLGSTVSKLLFITWYNFFTCSSKSSSSSHGDPSFGFRGMMTYFLCPFNLVLSFSMEILAFIFLVHGRSTRAG